MRDRVAPLAAQRQCSADRKGPPTLLQDCGDHCTKSLVVVTAGETP
jgi:hypothetical protein